MNDHGPLLHNMSVPPRSMVKYAGLANLLSAPGPGGADTTNTQAVTFGTPITFVLRNYNASLSAANILKRLRCKVEADPNRQLAMLIDARANELPLPDGCVVIPAPGDKPPDCRELLTVLAILAKCSDHVWLRAKRPSIHAALARRRATLLIPPDFIHHLSELLT